jgi:hypothetical protein
MAVSELNRVSASELESSTLVRTLALRAEAVLGYSWLRKKLALQPSTLATALEEIGIEPFRPEDVKRYKAERLLQAKKFKYSDLQERSLIEKFTTGLAPGSYVRGKWRRTQLQRFDGAVPEFALSHAIEIKERVPDVQFEVESLRIDSRYDPFLIARCGRKRFYIDVWDEPEFEKHHG